MLSRFIVLSPAVALMVAAGCGAGKGLHKEETIEEGPMAARRAAQADVQTQVEAGAPTLQGTTSSIPSLVPGEGHVQLPAAPAPPATAPPPDKFDNNNAEHLLARCRDRAARREWFDAVGDCRRSYEINPSSIEPQVELMRLLVTLQSYTDAEEAATKVLAARPNDPIALYYLAWSYRGRDQFPKAISTLQRAIAIDPKRVEFVQALAASYRLAGNYGKSIETIEHALSMQPNDPKLQAMLSETRTELAERLAPYQKLVLEKPNYDNQAALGFMYQKYGLSQKALTAYDTALAKLPGPLAAQEPETKKLAAQIYYNRGVVYHDLGKPELGEPALWQAMQLDPSLTAFSWYYIGLCRYDAGKYDTSIEALRKSVDLAPDVAENRTALAASYEKAGQAALATEQRNTVAAIEARAAAEKAASAKEASALASKSSAEAAAKAAAPQPPSPPPANAATAEPTADSPEESPPREP